MTRPTEVDIIVCGGTLLSRISNKGGSTGCVVAGRLANLDPKLKVLLIEGGENNYNNPWVYRPGIFPRNMKLDSKTATFYESNPSEHLNGRSAIVPAAHILGGGSSINFMMYTRASASDYDDFKTPGWTTKDLLPLMQKVVLSVLVDSSMKRTNALATIVRSTVSRAPSKSPSEDTRTP